MVCAGIGIAGQAGGCQGDSGGPFVCEENENWVLHGPVSWGNGMCTTDYYTVFARVSNFIDWINQKMSGSGGSRGSGGGSGKSEAMCVTLYPIPLAPAREPHQMELLFTYYKKGDFGAISVTEQN